MNIRPTPIRQEGGIMVRLMGIIHRETPFFCVFMVFCFYFININYPNYLIIFISKAFHLVKHLNFKNSIPFEN